MSMMSEFKAFAMKGNLVDIAVAFVMGGAFGKVVTSFTDGIVAPIIGLLTGGADFSKLKWIVRSAEADVAGAITRPEVALSYGAFLTNILDFIIVAFVMFMIVKAVNSMKKAEAAAPPPAPPRTEVLLEEIRNLLKK
jgi:large conductance mechanosensitive channel